MIDTARRIGVREQLDRAELRIDAARIELIQALQLEGDSEDTLLTDALRKIEEIKQDIVALGVTLRGK